MFKVTIFNTYYNQKQMLLQQLSLWNKYSKPIKDNFKFLIVDDCSEKENKAYKCYKEKLPEINLSIYYINEDKYCNIGGARNLGLTVCETDWIVISDIDHAFPEQTMHEIIQCDLSNPNIIYRFNRVCMSTRKIKEHPAIMLLNKETYWNIGGCDEDFVGSYGHTDVHFRYRAEKFGCKYKTANKTFLQLYAQGETSNIDRSKIEPNAKLFQQKVRNNTWSKDFLRFTYKREL